MVSFMPDVGDREQLAHPQADRLHRQSGRRRQLGRPDVVGGGPVGCGRPHRIGHQYVDFVRHNPLVERMSDAYDTGFIAHAPAYYIKGG